MQCTSPIRLRKNLDPSLYPDGLLVPCGKCMTCRVRRRAEWTMRLIHEWTTCPDAVFVTLTYDNAHLPYNDLGISTLVKSDLQKFFKRLRKSLTGTRKIRYYACGEYGDHTYRPHYHIILFGLRADPRGRKLIMDAWPYADWSVDEIRDKSFGAVSEHSIRYVAQYIDKKYMGADAERHYEMLHRQPVFKVSSLGIGREFCDQNADQLYDNKHTSLKGVKMALPRYYKQRLAIPPEILRQMAIDKQCDEVYALTGVYCTRDEYYREYGTVVERRCITIDKQRDADITARGALQTRSKI